MNAVLAQPQAQADWLLKSTQGLAINLWSRCYKQEAPDWKPLDDLAGVISQIDNMTTGMERKATTTQPMRPATREEKIVQPGVYEVSVQVEQKPVPTFWKPPVVHDCGEEEVAHPSREPDLSHLKPQTQERIREWLKDGTFVERAIGTMQEQERELVAYEAQKPSREQHKIGCVQHDCDKCSKTVALVQQLVDALDYHVCQTRPIDKSSKALNAAHKWLKGNV